MRSILVYAVLALWVIVVVPLYGIVGLLSIFSGFPRSAVPEDFG